MRLIVTIISLFVFAAFSSKGQHFSPVSYHLTTEHGLPSNEVYEVFEDSKGYMWFATDEGVARYDGNQFTIFTTEDGLTDNVIFKFVEDQGGNIWFVSYNSTLSYFKDNKIFPYVHNDVISKYLNGKISTNKQLDVYDDRIVYNLFGVGIIEVLSDGKLIDHHLEDNAFCDIELYKKHYIAYNSQKVTETSVNCYSIKNGASTFMTVLPREGFFRGNFAQSDNNGLSKRFIVANNNIYDKKTSKLIYNGVGLLELIVKDSTHWICDLYGLKKAQFDGEKLKVVDEFLKNISITNLTFDKSQRIWISTLNSGVYVIKNEQIQSYKAVDDNTTIEKLLVWDNCIYTVGNKYLENTKNQNQSYYRDQFLNTQSPYYQPRKHWTERHRNTKQDYNHIMMSYFKRIKYNDLVNYAFDQGSNKIELFNIESNELQLECHLTSVTESITGMYLNNRHNGVVWSRNSLYYIKDSLTKKINLPIVNNQSILISNVIIDGDLIYIASSNLGLICLKNEKLEFQLNKYDGLLLNKTTDVLKMPNGLILVLSSSGINFFYEKNLHNIGTIGVNDLYSRIDAIDFKELHDTLYIGTKNKVYRIPMSLLDTKLSQKANNYQLYHTSNFKQSNGIIVVPPGQPILNVSFELLDYDNFLTKKYQYRFKGEKQWISISSPEINIYKPKGDFDLEIRHALDNGQWSESISLVKVSVQQYWYEKPWVIISLVLLLVGIIFIIYNKRQEAVVKKIRIQNQLLTLQQRMQYARLNPHFIFNVLNSIHSYVLYEDKEMAEKYLNRFSKLMREVLNQTSEGTTKISNEISLINKYVELELLRSSTPFVFNLVNEVNDEYKIPSLMVQPFVENAILHGITKYKGTYVELCFSRTSKGNIQVTITNDFGDKLTPSLPDSSSNSNAVGIIKNRIDHYGQIFKNSELSLRVQQINNTFVVELIIPIIYDEK